MQGETSGDRAAEQKFSTARGRLLAVLNGCEPREGVFSPLVDWRYASQFARRDVLYPDPMDQVLVAEACGYDPIVIVDWNLQPYNPNLRWKVVKVTEGENYRDELRILESPVGTVSMVRRATGGLMWVIEQPLKTQEDYKVGEWYLEQVMATKDGIVAQVREELARIGGRGLLCMRPEVDCLRALHADRVYHSVDFPEVVDSYERKREEAASFMARTAIGAGADMIFFGGSPAHMCSLETFRSERVPRLRALCDLIRECGGYSYYHVCQPQRDIVYSGVMNEIKPSLYETLSPPPAGNIDDLREAREHLDPGICTKGNLEMGILYEGPIERIVAETKKIIDDTHGYRHMVGCSDGVLLDTPIEHLRTMADTARTYGW